MSNSEISSPLTRRSFGRLGALTLGAAAIATTAPSALAQSTGSLGSLSGGGIGGGGAPAPHIIDEIIRLTNVERRNAGLVEVVRDEKIMQWAQAWADHCGRTNHFGHSDYKAFENMAGGSSASEMVWNWMNSPGHRANMMNPDRRVIGVGAATHPRYRYVASQQFMDRPTGHFDSITPMTQQQAIDGIRQAIVDVRRNHNRTSVWNSSMAPRAKMWAERMAQNGAFEFDPTVPYRERVAVEVGPNPISVMHKWLYEDSGTRSILIGANTTSFVVGAARSPASSQMPHGGFWWITLRYTQA